jgi:Uncharacterized conserved protein
MSKSGELAGTVREMMAEVDIRGAAETAKDVDRRLKACRSVVATADGTIIDAVSSVIDLPGEVGPEAGDRGGCCLSGCLSRRGMIWPVIVVVGLGGGVADGSTWVKEGGLRLSA